MFFRQTDAEKVSLDPRKILLTNICVEPDNLDPRQLTLAPHDPLIAALFEGLMSRNSTDEIEYGQATSVNISQDKKTYTFSLGKNFWNNGDPITAHDFAETWIDLLNPQAPAPRAYLLDSIRNAKKVRKGEAPLSGLGIQAITDNLLQVELEQPFPPFLHLVSTPFLAPIHHKNETEFLNWSEDESPVFLCNGPFQLAFWGRGENITLIRNPFYRKKNSSIDAIRASFIPSAEIPLHLFRDQYLDLIASTSSSISHTHLKTLKQAGYLATRPHAATWYLSFNVQRPPFNNINIRKAFALAMNREFIAKEILQLDELPAFGFVPPILKGGRVSKFFEDRNPILAGKLLEKGLDQLGWTKEDLMGSLLTFSTTVEASEKIAQYLRQYWFDALGIWVKTKSRTPGALYKEAKSRRYQMALMSRTADYLDPIAMLTLFCDPNAIANRPGWYNEEFNQLLEVSSSCDLHSIKRLTLLEKAEKLLMQEMPIAPLYHPTIYSLSGSKIEALSMDAFGVPCFDQMRLKGESEYL